MLLLLKQERHTFVTTMFDYYGMPKSWPGRVAAKRAVFINKARIVEDAIRSDIAKGMGRFFDSQRFIPYVQMHEFEALLFSQPRTVCEVLRSPETEPLVEGIRAEFATPEEIDDGPQSAPSKRLLDLFSDYRKRFHGLIAAERIGIERLQSECPHFADWSRRLERLAEGEAGES